MMGQDVVQKGEIPDSPAIRYYRTATIIWGIILSSIIGFFYLPMIILPFQMYYNIPDSNMVVSMFIILFNFLAMFTFGTLRKHLGIEKKTLFKRPAAIGLIILVVMAVSFVPGYRYAIENYPGTHIYIDGFNYTIEMDEGGEPLFNKPLGGVVYSSPKTYVEVVVVVVINDGEFLGHWEVYVEVLSESDELGSLYSERGSMGHGTEPDSYILTMSDDWRDTEPVERFIASIFFKGEKISDKTVKVSDEN